MARSRLYRSQCLQINTRLKALGEIYKIYIPLHLSDLKNIATCVKTFAAFFQNFVCRFVLKFDCYWKLNRISHSSNQENAAKNR